MRTLMVHAHPESGSFVSAMRDIVAGELAAQGGTIEHSDLYAMNFNPVLSRADFAEPRNPDGIVFALEQRHAYDSGTLAPDIAAEIEKVLAADLIVFTFPLFWFSVPAILKGWIDRVFISGPFYGGRRIYDGGGLAGKRSLAAFSLGGREHMFGSGTIHGELEQGMLRHFLQGALGYVGLEVVEPYVAYHVPYVTPEQRGEMLAGLRAHVAQLDTLPRLAMPRLAGFDARFAPI